MRGERVEEKVRVSHYDHMAGGYVFQNCDLGHSGEFGKNRGANLKTSLWTRKILEIINPEPSRKLKLWKIQIQKLLINYTLIN